MNIGVFDSGIGGITVLTELRKTLPGTRFTYIGDTAHVPYGTRSPEQIKKLSRACAETLKSKRVDAVVVACNTASSLALDEIRDALGSTPVIGVVEPGVTAALEALNKQPAHTPALVLATRATVRSGAYGKLLRGHGHEVFEQACPLLVPMIEEGWVDHPILHQTLQEYIAPYKTKQGVALLGCTHYPWIAAAFRAALGKGWEVVDSAHAVAAAVTRTDYWQKRAPSANRELGKVEWIFTDPNAVPAFAQKYIQGA